MIDKAICIALPEFLQKLLCYVLYFLYKIIRNNYSRKVLAQILFAYAADYYSYKKVYVEILLRLLHNKLLGK